jgi:deoxycytidine triphosphate deaminase
MVEHRQPVCKLAFERMREDPDVLYGEDAGSSYQGQQTMLSKHFAAQTAGGARRTPRGSREAVKTA